MANGDPKTYQDGYADGYRQGAQDARQRISDQLRRPSIPLPYEMDACPSCGMNFSGTTGYVCPRSYCPIQPKATC